LSTATKILPELSNHKSHLTVGRARSILGCFWFSLLLPLFIIIVYQIVVNRYPDGWTAPWGWFSTLVLPIWSLIIIVLTATKNFTHEIPVHSKSLFYIALVISAVYILALYMILLIGGQSQAPLEQTLNNSTLYMGAMQAIVTSVLAKFFVENLEPAENRSAKEAAP